MGLVRLVHDKKADSFLSEHSDLESGFGFTQGKERQSPGEINCQELRSLFDPN